MYVSKTAPLLLLCMEVPIYLKKREEGEGRDERQKYLTLHKPTNHLHSSSCSPRALDLNLQASAAAATLQQNCWCSSVHGPPSPSPPARFSGHNDHNKFAGGPSPSQPFLVRFLDLGPTPHCSPLPGSLKNCWRSSMLLR